MIKRFLFINFLILFIGGTAFYAQQSLETKQQEHQFDEAMFHFENGRFGMARILFE